MSHNTDIKSLWQQSAKQETITLYNDAFNQYGYDLQSLFIPKGRQRIRFRILTEVGIQNGDSVLDVGCGFGHFCEFLTREHIQVKYTGIDLIEPFIMTARKVHPQGDFRIQDILQDTIKEQWDYVVLSGVFNIIPEGFNRRTQWQFIQAMLAKMMGLAKKGIAADFQSIYVDFQAQDAFHVDPCEVFRFGKTLSRRVVVRHDYMPYEFAVYVYKDDKITSNNVFSDFAQYVDWYTENEFYGNFAASYR